jgi:hypothetical protein
VQSSSKPDSSFGSSGIEQRRRETGATEIYCLSDIESFKAKKRHNTTDVWMVERAVLRTPRR